MDIRQTVEDAFLRRAELTAAELAALGPCVEEGLRALDRGELRAATPVNGHWVVDATVKKLILLSFLTAPRLLAASSPGRPKAFDKIPLKFEAWGEAEFLEANLRVVPGAVVRHGAHIGPGVILMPCFVNVGAYVGAGTMVDTWATIGSCAQVGERCHISGGVGIGGVLEPITAGPVIIEDDVFIGARSEIAEGIRVRRGAVIGMGVYLGRSTPIIDRASGETYFGEVPENAVVVPGARADARYSGLSIYAAVIAKYADEGTRGKTALNELVRDPS